MASPAYASKAHWHNPVEQRAARHCSQQHPSSCILRAALHFRISYSWLHGVAWCESRLSPYAHNASGASGLFQFMPSTFASTRYGNHSLWSAKWASLAAASMFAAGQSHQWVCR